MKDYLEHLRAKPEEIRKRIALGAAGAITGVVALGWLIALVSSNALSLTPTDAPVAERSGSFGNDLAGAAATAFYPSANGGEITIVEEESSSTLDRNEVPEEEPTVIHF